MLAKVAAIAAALAIGVQAECPNACSGNGLCSAHDQCKCDPGFLGNDCSQRLCPFDNAFVDIPIGDLNHDGLVLPETYVKLSSGNSGVSNVAQYEVFPVSASQGGYAAKTEEGHFYMECSGTGSCDRSTGQCTCYPGYTGSACQRTQCPNDCSGKGKCRTLREVAKGALSRRASGSVSGNLIIEGVEKGFNYNLWDADKHQQCVCDAGYGGPDCSERMCPLGNDPLTPDTPRWCGGELCTNEIQEFVVSPTGPTTYRFTFTDITNITVVAYATIDVANAAPGFVPDPSTTLAGPTTNAGRIMTALRTAPGNLLSQVEVMAMGPTPNTVPAGTFRVVFAGLSGNQYPLEVSTASGPGKVDVAPVVEISRGNMESVECSSRGTCDRTSGICNCFGGYVGSACEYQNALASGAKASSTK